MATLYLTTDTLGAHLIESAIDEDFLAPQGLGVSLRMECGGMRVTIKIELSAGKTIHTKCELQSERATRVTLHLSAFESNALHSWRSVHVYVIRKYFTTLGSSKINFLAL